MTVDPACSRNAPVALCLGGLDPSAGAGLLRDALTVWELGGYPMAIPTAETRQNGLACLEIAAPGMSARERLEALRPHLSGLWGAKLGLCALPEAELRRVAELLAELGPVACIWDPILAPTAGVGLHGADDLQRMAAVFLAQPGWVVSPNRPEAAAFGGLQPSAPPADLARAFLAAGAEAVWLKGGHAEGAAEDFWIDRAGVRSLGARPRLPGDRRGTGCTLAAAWLAHCLQGLDAFTAAQRASAWLHLRWPQAALPGGAGRPSFAPVPA